MGPIEKLDERLKVLRKRSPVVGGIVTMVCAAVAFVAPIGLLILSPIILGSAQLIIVIGTPILLLALWLGIVKWQN